METATSRTDPGYLSYELDTEPVVRHLDRYAGLARSAGAVICGVIAGALLVNSMQVGVAFGMGEDHREWDVLEWGNHWMWRGIASVAATSAAAFVAGVIGRRRGRLIGALSAVPSALYWVLIAYVGWIGHIPGTFALTDVPLGYRIVAVLLALGTVPCGAAFGREGAAYGHANAPHFDARRATLLGIRWYHFIWLPLLIHFMLLTAAFGSVYGFQWLTAVWKSGMSVFAIVPVIFLMAMLATLQLLGNGGLGAYQALAGFDDGSRASTFRRVMKFGFGYMLATALAQGLISVVHFGLVALIRKIFG